MRLIDADAFKRYLDDGDECINCQKKEMFCSYHCELDNVESNQFERIIDEQPTIDAVEVKHGEWLKTDEFPHRVYCSVCFKTYVTNEEAIQGRSWDCPVYAYEAEYCPHCGAKMDGKEQDDGKTTN